MKKYFGRNNTFNNKQKKDHDLDSLIDKLNRLENGPTVKLDLDELKDRDKDF